MVIVSTCKMRKSMVLIVGLFIIGVIVFGTVMGYDMYQQAKADRSNAKQVSKVSAVEQVVSQASPDFFTEYRLEREKIRSERSDLLREGIKNAKNEDSMQHAQDEVLKLVQEKQKEAEMENLIKARGFTDALVFIRDNSVSVVVKTSSLSREEVAQVADIISRVAGVKAEDITISAKP